MEKKEVRQITLFQSWGNSNKPRTNTEAPAQSVLPDDQPIDLCRSDDDDDILPCEALVSAANSSFEDLSSLSADHDAENEAHASFQSNFGVGIQTRDQTLQKCNISIDTKEIMPTQGLTQTTSLSGFDTSAGKLWIYPTNYPIRDYQYNIVQQALYKNTMVTLPTGLGKTFIAAVVMYNFYRWYPQGKVVFMAPTKPLVAQQIEACYNIMGIPQDHTAEMTGSMGPSKRVSAWHRKRVFFLTPQVLTNDLSRGSCPAASIKCIVIDEAHKALGNHAYCQITEGLSGIAVLLQHVLRELVKYTENFRVLALSATPGSDMKAVQQVLTNLLISHIEIRTEESFDIQKYSFARKVQKIVVPLGDELSKVKAKYMHIMDVFVAKLKKQGVLYSRDTGSFSKYLILKAREAFRQNPPVNLQRSQYGIIEGDFALAMSLYHGYELLQLHGSRSLYNYLEGILTGDKSYGRTRVGLVRNVDFNELMDMLTTKYKDTKCEIEIATGSVADARPLIIGHPKMEKLQEIVLDHFRSIQDARTRVMIFSQYRDSVKEITTILDVHKPLIKVMSFIGHSSAGKSCKGYTQKEQLQVMKKFREGGYNTLVATCVGEEGLDIGEVDLIICFDAHKSPIRLVQRMGRTGRKREGKIVMLVTEGKEEQIYNQSQYSKKRIHKAILNGAQSLHFYQHSPRMVPNNVTPTCHKMHITVKEDFIPTKKVSATKGITNQNKLPVDASSEIITLDEYTELYPWLVPEQKVPKLPALHITCLQESFADIQLEEGGKFVSLSDWTPWQNMLQDTVHLDHSLASRHLVELMEFIQVLQSLEADCNVYETEMKSYLNEADIMHQEKSSIFKHFMNRQQTKDPGKGLADKRKLMSARKSHMFPKFDLLEEMSENSCEETFPEFIVCGADNNLKQDGTSVKELNKREKPHKSSIVTGHDLADVSNVERSEDVVDNNEASNLKKKLKTRNIVKSRATLLEKKMNETVNRKRTKMRHGNSKPSVVDVIADNDSDDFDCKIQVENKSDCVTSPWSDLSLKNNVCHNPKIAETALCSNDTKYLADTVKISNDKKCLLKDVAIDSSMISYRITTPPLLESAQLCVAEINASDFNKLNILEVVDEWHRENMSGKYIAYSGLDLQCGQNNSNVDNNCLERLTSVAENDAKVGSFEIDSETRKINVQKDNRAGSLGNANGTRKINLQNVAKLGSLGNDNGTRNINLKNDIRAGNFGNVNGTRKINLQNAEGVLAINKCLKGKIQTFEIVGNRNEISDKNGMGILNTRRHSQNIRTERISLPHSFNSQNDVDKITTPVVLDRHVNVAECVSLSPVNDLEYISPPNLISLHVEHVGSNHSTLTRTRSFIMEDKNNDKSSEHSDKGVSDINQFGEAMSVENNIARTSNISVDCQDVIKTLYNTNTEITFTQALDFIHNSNNSLEHQSPGTHFTCPNSLGNRMENNYGSISDICLNITSPKKGITFNLLDSKPNNLEIFKTDFEQNLNISTQTLKHQKENKVFKKEHKNASHLSLEQCKENVEKHTMIADNAEDATTQSPTTSQNVDFPQFDLNFDFDEDIIPPSPAVKASFHKTSVSIESQTGIKRCNKNKLQLRKNTADSNQGTRKSHTELFGKRFYLKSQQLLNSKGKHTLQNDIEMARPVQQGQTRNAYIEVDGTVNNTVKRSNTSSGFMQKHMIDRITETDPALNVHLDDNSKDTAQRGTAENVEQLTGNANYKTYLQIMDNNSKKSVFQKEADKCVENVLASNLLSPICKENAFEASFTLLNDEPEDWINTGEDNINDNDCKNVPNFSLSNEPVCNVNSFSKMMQNKHVGVHPVTILDSKETTESTYCNNGNDDCKNVGNLVRNVERNFYSIMNKMSFDCFEDSFNVSACYIPAAEIAGAVSERKHNRSTSTPVTSLNKKIQAVTPMVLFNNDKSTGSVSTSCSKRVDNDQSISDTNDSFIVRKRKRALIFNSPETEADIVMENTAKFKSPDSEPGIEKEKSKTKGMNRRSLQYFSNDDEDFDFSKSSMLTRVTYISGGCKMNQEAVSTIIDNGDVQEEVVGTRQVKFQRNSRKISQKVGSNYSRNDLKTNIKNTKSRLSNPFLDIEAEISEAEDVSTDEENGSDLDFYEGSFIHDSQFSQHDKLDDSDIQAIYLKSVKSPMAQRGSYKLQHHHRNVNVFSQVPAMEESQYMEDSFCVGSDDIEDDDWLLGKEDTGHTGEVTVMNPDVSMLNTDRKKRKRGIKSFQTTREREIHSVRMTALSKIRSKLSSQGKIIQLPRKYLSSSDEDVESWNKSSKLVKASKRSRIKRTLDTLSDDVDNVTRNDFNTMHSQTEIPLGRKRSRILKSSDESDEDFQDNRTISKKNFSIVGTTKKELGEINEFNCASFTNDLAKTEEATAKTSHDLLKEERLKRQRLKQAEYKKTFIVHKHNINESCFIDADMQSLTKIKGKESDDTVSIIDSIGSTENLCVKTNLEELGNTSKDVLLSDFVSTRNYDHKAVILVDSKELSGSQDIISDLRFKHNMNVITAQLPGCDFIISNRMAVERKQWSDFSNGSNRSKLIERLQHLGELYDRPCLIVERDRIRPGEEKSTRVVHWTKYVDRTLAMLLRSTVKVLFTDNNVETADLLAELCKLEQRKNMGIDTSIDIGPKKLHFVKFYASMPMLSYIHALNLSRSFTSISEFLKSSVSVIEKKGKMSASRAAEVHHYIFRTFNLHLLSSECK